MIVLSDTGFHAAAGDPANLQLCQRGEWEDRMLVETVLDEIARSCTWPLRINTTGSPFDCHKIKKV